jgi:hypothetical protein
MGAFEDFVNTELPLRISTQEDGGGTGNLPAGKLLRTTGIGLSVETIPGEDISGSPTKTTLLTVVSKADSGAEFFVNSSGNKYIKEKDDGNLGNSSSEFLSNENIQIYLNGNNMIKGDHVQWTSNVSFIFGFSVDPGDFIKIVS